MDIAKHTSTTPDPFKFVLKSKGVSVTCNESPMGWDDGVMELNRRMDDGAGVVQTFVVENLTFIGNGAKFIKDEFEKYEGNTEMTLTVYELRPLSMDYVPFVNTYKLVFNSPYKTVKVGEFNIGVNIGLISSGAVAKYDDRKSVKLDLTKRESLGEMELTPFKEITGYPALFKLRIQAMSEFLNAKLSQSARFFDDSMFKFLSTYNSLPIQNAVSDFEEVQGTLQFYRGLSTTTNIPYIFKNSKNARNLVMSFVIRVNVTNAKTVGDVPYELFLEKFDVNDVSIEKTRLATWGGEIGIKVRGSDNIAVSLNEGDSLKLIVKMQSPSGLLQNWECYWISTEIKFREEIINTPERTIEGLPVYEALEFASQKVMDDETAFYSDYFGRTDKGYTTESQLRHAHVASGVNIRGLELEDDSGGINMSLEDILKGISNLWNTGHSIEFINDRFKLRVEDFDYFFNDVVIFDLSDRVTELDIEGEYMPDLGYVEILTGYQNYVYRSTNGRGEYNTESTRTTTLNNPNTLDLKSEFRADTTGISNCLEMPVKLTGSEDIEEDGHVFIIKSQREGSAWVAEKEENIQIVNNSSLFGDSSLNLYFTPLRNLIRNANRFVAALQKMPGSKIKHQTSNKYQNLETTGEGYTVIENGDLIVSDLATPKYRLMKHTFECYFTNAEMRTLNERGSDGVMNYLKLIKFGNKYGWILNVSKKLTEDKATFELIEKL